MNRHGVGEIKKVEPKIEEKKTRKSKIGEIDLGRMGIVEEIGGIGIAIGRARLIRTDGGVAIRTTQEIGRLTEYVIGIENRMDGAEPTQPVMTKKISPRMLETKDQKLARKYRTKN